MMPRAVTGTGFVDLARQYLGVPYVWGGESPSGFDCSGLVQFVLDKMGISNVPRTSESQWNWVQRITQNQLQPGDLIFETWPGEVPPGHVAIYAGSGQIIEAPGTGQTVHEVPWTPGEITASGGQVIGYGRVPGMSYPGGNNAAPSGGGPGGLLSIPSEITGFFDDAQRFVHAALWVVNPANWVRIIAGVFGVLLAGAGIIMLARAA